MLYQSKDCPNCDEWRRVCATCGVAPLRQGYSFPEDLEYYCDDHEPTNMVIVDKFCATFQEMYEESEELGGDVAYWTEWEAGEDGCDCSVGG